MDAMHVYAISGSATIQGSNQRLLRSMAAHFGQYRWELDAHLLQLPLYRPELEQAPLPDSVRAFRQNIASAGAVIISTPEYLHNIPAVLKNGLEWLRSSGELYGKAVLPITFTPHAPRGEHAMASLLQSLRALEARIVVELPLFQNQLTPNQEGLYNFEGEAAEWLEAAMALLGPH